MEKIIRTVDHKTHRVQITTADERWYLQPTTDPTTGLPTYTAVPSVTWIGDFYPKGVGFYKWLANTGWDESHALKEAAGDKGSKVHTAVSALLLGETIAMDAAILNPSTESPDPLTVEEYECLMSFVAWHQTYRPGLIAQNVVVWNQTHGYAGTLDALFRILPAFADKTVPAGLVLVDFKTSKSVWMPHRLQVSAYKHTPEVDALAQGEPVALGILQLGYRLTKTQYKFTPVEDEFALFLSTKQIWAKETAGDHPKQRDYPLTLTLTHPAPPAQKE